MCMARKKDGGLGDKRKTLSQMHMMLIVIEPHDAQI